jgi:AcrR family transcriptional regulator
MAIGAGRDLAVVVQRLHSTIHAHADHGHGRRRGRPRSAEADRAIVDAALELIADGGIGALSMEQVAGRAGVGKATVYRRWPSKEALVGDALATLNDHMPDEFDGETSRDQITAALEHIRCHGMQTLAGRIYPRMLGYRRSNPEWFDIFQERVLEPRRERFREMVRTAVDAGEIRPDVDVDLATTMLVAPILYLNLYSTRTPDPKPDGTTEKVVEMVFSGLAPSRASDS